MGRIVYSRRARRNTCAPGPLCTTLSLFIGCAPARADEALHAKAVQPTVLEVLYSPPTSLSSEIHFAHISHVMRIVCAIAIRPSHADRQGGRPVRRAHRNRMCSIGSSNLIVPSAAVWTMTTAYFHTHHSLERGFHLPPLRGRSQLLRVARRDSRAGRERERERERECRGEVMPIE